MITKQANMKISKKNWKKKGIALSLKLWRLEQFLYQFLGQIGISWRNRSKSMKCLTEITENYSMRIWNKRNVPWNISKLTCHGITCSRMHYNILIPRADLKIYISPLDVDLIGCFNEASCQ